MRLQKDIFVWEVTPTYAFASSPPPPSLVETTLKSFPQVMEAYSDVYMDRILVASHTREEHLVSRLKVNFVESIVREDRK